MSIQVTRAEFNHWYAKINKLNQRAARKGFPSRIELDGVPVIIRNDGRQFPDLPAGVEVEMIEATIAGEPPCYGGWRFLAGLDGLKAADSDEVNWVVRYAPGIEDETLVDRSRLQVGWCDHCQTRRANRRHLFVVQNVESGEIKQVGSSCIKDFLGWSTSPVFFSTDDAEEQLERGYGGWAEAFTPKTVVTVALAAIEAAGWVPKSAAEGRVSTASLVLTYLVDRGKPGRAARELITPHIEEAEKLAPTVIDTILSEFVDDDYGYGADLYAVLRAESVGDRQFGLACSAVSAYKRILGQPAETTTKAEAKPEREWLGQEGDKVTITGTIRTVMVVDGYAYNTTQVFLIIDAGPTLAKIYTSAQWAYEDEVDTGATITITATVKAHETYQDEKQTVLTRAKRVDAPAER